MTRSCDNIDLEIAFERLTNAAESIDRRTGSTPAEDADLAAAALIYAAEELEMAEPETIHDYKTAIYSLRARAGRLETGQAEPTQ